MSQGDVSPPGYKPSIYEAPPEWHRLMYAVELTVYCGLLDAFRRGAPETHFTLSTSNPEVRAAMEAV